jgi:radical SAM family uncharacterized protein/radical SAM-linked protein
MKEFLPYFPRPSHYAGNEVNSVHKDPEDVSTRVALIFPDVYEIGMSYCGQKILYHLLNQKNRIWAERVFAPSLEAAAVLRQRSGVLCSLESDTALTAFDLLAFSLTHELCYSNILYILDLAGIPLEAGNRDLSHPLVAAGGGAVFNAEPVAEFFDFMVLGDGEEALPEIVALLDRAGQNISRPDFLWEISKIKGVYVPSFFDPDTNGGRPKPRHPGYTRVEKAVVPNLDDLDFPVNQVVPFGKPIHDRFSIEVARGCTRGCRFCHAGMTYRPVRERDPKNILRLVQSGLNKTGFEEVSFLSLSTGDYSRLTDLFRAAYSRCAREQVSMALPSLRAGSVNEELMQLMASIRHTGATIAPEAGTNRLRQVINKGITEEEFLEHTRQLFAFGWNSIKLYFMLGLPTEKMEDLDGILKTCIKVRETAGEKARRRVRITASVSPFVPKTHTPFQWEKQLAPEEVKERLGYLQEITKPHKWLSLKWQDPEMSALEGVFSRGGRELAQVLKEAFQKRLFFTSWSDCLNFEGWKSVLTENGIDFRDYLKARNTDRDLPWDHLISGVSQRFLLAERNKAYKGISTVDCREGGCTGCGVCNHLGRDSLLSGQGKSMKIEPVFADNTLAEEGPIAGKENWSPEEDPAHKGSHVRRWYSKTGDCRWLSQLEVQKVLDRGMRRADLPMTFSSGFHPLPLFSFGQALPVGVESLSEWVNIFFRRRLEEKEAVLKLNNNLPRGLEALRIQELSMAKRQPRPVAEKYKITFSPDQEHWAQERWTEFMDADSFLVHKQGKKKMQALDLRPLVLGHELNRNELVTFFDWRETYISPLFFLKSVFTGFSLATSRVLKLGQAFETGNEAEFV